MYAWIWTTVLLCTGICTQVAATLLQCPMEFHARSRKSHQHLRQFWPSSKDIWCSFQRELGVSQEYVTSLEAERKGLELALAAVKKKKTGFSTSGSVQHGDNFTDSELPKLYRGRDVEE